MTFQEWTKRWGIPPQAVLELLTATDYEIPEGGPTSEAGVQAAIRREASQKGCRLWRNNTGVLSNPETGVPVRFGLCNDSKRGASLLASSDLIGIRPVIIRPEYVGRVIGQFMTREVKPSTWKYRGTKREQRQAAFIALVKTLGGDAMFATHEGTI